MLRENYEFDQRAYDADHIKLVLADMEANFDGYFGSFATDRKALMDRFDGVVREFKKEQPKYEELFDEETLEEFTYDPNAFKTQLRKKCPIIVRCLGSQAKVMEAYKASFYQTSGQRLLEVTTQIVQFGRDYMRSFHPGRHLQAQSPAELGLSELDTEPYTAFGVIGGGIRSHFLYQLYPQAFPSRSQNAIWALYFLVSRKDYDFTGGSEFLMIEPKGTQQNYFYPYDLFAFYAKWLFQKLDAVCVKAPYYLRPQYRYVYVDAFFDHIADCHRSDINILKPEYERLDY